MFSRLVTGFILAVISLLAVSCAEREDIRKPVFSRDAVDELVETSETAGYHVVQKGETLYSIAAKYGVSVSSIRRANKIADTTSIKQGMRLSIPGKDLTQKSDAKPRAEQAPRSAPSTSGRFIWPVKPVLIGSGFGIRNDSKHDGVDLRGEKGDPIVASGNGKVIFSGSGPTGYGKMVVVKHDSRIITIYAHNDENLVPEGQEVKQGDKIATIGNSGRARGYHCHFEMRIDRKPSDPAKHLPEPK
ncbi:MAG: M23 family metallopeptidase [Nitrospinae bacterium]|nr:M23 family metallopeptidase [Nitrospinota bacterium]